MTPVVIQELVKTMEFLAANFTAKSSDADERGKTRIIRLDTDEHGSTRR
jgi:hypothetical protein